MTLLVIAGLTIGALAALGFPLMGRRPDGPEPAQEGSEADDLVARKDSIYGDIRDLELDRRTGKIAEADYEAMRADFEIEAARIVERLKTGNGSSPAGAGPAGSTACADCGTEAPAGARFCPGCGRHLSAQCSSCGAPVGPDDRFCGGCGERLVSSPVTSGR